MNLVANSVPFFAVVVAQFAEPDAGKLSVYGPIGIICLWLMWRDERQRKDVQRVHFDGLKENEKMREELRGVAHQMKGLNRNLLYMTATNGPDGLRQVAERELERSSGAE